MSVDPWSGSISVAPAGITGQESLWQGSGPSAAGGAIPDASFRYFPRPCRSDLDPACGADRSTASVVVGPDDEHRAGGVANDVVGNRSEQCAAKSPTPARSDHDGDGRNLAGEITEGGSGTAFHDAGLDAAAQLPGRVVHNVTGGSEQSVTHAGEFFRLHRRPGMARPIVDQ